MKISNTFSIFGIKKSGIKKLPGLLALHAFALMLILIFSFVIVGMLLFYTNVLLVKMQQQDVSGEAVTFKSAAYKNVLKLWQDKELKFQQSGSESSGNPFK